ncbi:MAG: cytochrome c biogenesis protein CcdA, partial [Oscillospiraceae bacterium]|nr:cytochrome c biogenesis protein CcdA [Oscillospiraceae bacterium]
FVAMGATAGALGGLLTWHLRTVNLVLGTIVILFGLNYLGVLKVNLFRGSRRQVQAGQMGFFSSVLFGLVFSVGWTPCVGAFLGSALMLASQQGSMMEGMLMLLCYSQGLGIPFVFSAVLIDRLKTAFDFIKNHYGIINKVCGGLLVLIGILMATGTLGWLLTMLS